VLVVAYRDADGYWNGWKNSKPFPASPDGFAEAAWTLPALPREAQALGIGVNVVEDREATVDGFSLVEQ
jgi:hypothetical protein